MELNLTSVAPSTKVSLVSVSSMNGENLQLTNKAYSVDILTSLLKPSALKYTNNPQISSLQHSQIKNINIFDQQFDENIEPLFDEFRQNSSESIFSTFSNPISLGQTPFPITLSNISPSLKSAYQNRRKSSVKQSYQSIESYTDIIFDDLHTNQRRKSSLTSSIALSPSDIHPLSYTHSLVEPDEYIKKPLKFIPHPTTNSNDSSLYQKTPIYLESVRNASFSAILRKMSKSVNTSLKTNTLPFQSNPNISLKSKKHIALETFSQDFDEIPTFHENIEIDTREVDFILPIQLFGKINRIREQRLNPKYLLIYSFDKSIQTHLENIEEYEIDLFDDLLLEKYHQATENDTLNNNINLMDNNFNWRLLSFLQLKNGSKQYDEQFIQNLKLASIARYKLWSAVTLPPRSDSVPNISNIVNNIIPSASIENCEVPWVSLDNLKNGKAIKKLTNSAGFLKNSNVQYVSKNCQSKRWVSHTL